MDDYELCCHYCFQNGLHQGHQVLDLQAAYQKYYIQQSENLENIKKLYQHKEAIINKYQEHLEVLQNTKQLTFQSLEQDKAKIYQALEEKFGKLNQQLQNQFQEAQNTVTQEIEKQKQLQQKLEASNLNEIQNFRQVFILLKNLGETNQLQGEPTYKQLNFQLNKNTEQALQSIQNLYNIKIEFLNNQIYLLSAQYLIWPKNFSDQVFVFDCQSKKFQLVSTKPKIQFTDFQGTLQLPNNQLLICGDYPISNRALLVDQNGTVTNLASFEGARSTCKLVYQQEKNTVFLISGAGFADAPLKECSKMILGSNQWIPIADIIFPTFYQACVLHKGKIYNFGGSNNSTQISFYDIQLDKWQVSNVFLPQNITESFGYSNGEEIMVFASYQKRIYTFNEQQIEESASEIPQCYFYACQPLIFKNQIIINNYYNVVCIYNLTTKTWASLSPSV